MINDKARRFVFFLLAIVGTNVIVIHIQNWELCNLKSFHRIFTVIEKYKLISIRFFTFWTWVRYLWMVSSDDQIGKYLNANCWMRLLYTSDVCYFPLLTGSIKYNVVPNYSTRFSSDAAKHLQICFWIDKSTWDTHEINISLMISNKKHIAQSKGREQLLNLFFKW